MSHVKQLFLLLPVEQNAMGSIKFDFGCVPYCLKARIISGWYFSLGKRTLK